MKTSWKWLNEYVRLETTPERAAEKLTMAGLNLEECVEVDEDTVLDLEVTSNRPDCLGHIGVARELSVLFEKDLHVPAAEVAEEGAPAEAQTSVTIECPELCPRYVARVIRGVRVGPSPQWMQQRLKAVGIEPINNVVDATNYVLMECGQPLHAFDFAKLEQQRIVVRRARPGEKILAINHREYELTPETCVIADARRPVAIGGVMGGADTEITEATEDVLIEVAEFAPLSIRNTARRLNLHSESSFRFERGVDPCQLDWASRRCCELILQTAGGTLARGCVWAGEPAPETRNRVRLRFEQIPRLLGVEIPPQTCVRILSALGCEPVEEMPGAAKFSIPSWRRDLQREVDLIEEVARIAGYDRIPEDAVVPTRLSRPSLRDRVTDRVHAVMTACGFFETITPSLVSRQQFAVFDPHPDAERIEVQHSSWKLENTLRHTLIPSLLHVRGENERRGNGPVDLYEIANVYLARRPGDPEAEQPRLAFVTSRPFLDAKGLVELLIERIAPQSQLDAAPFEHSLFVPGRAAQLALGGRPFGWLGEVSREARE